MGSRPHVPRPYGAARRLMQRAELGGPSWCGASTPCLGRFVWHACGVAMVCAEPRPRGAAVGFLHVPMRPGAVYWCVQRPGSYPIRVDLSGELLPPVWDVICTYVA